MSRHWDDDNYECDFTDPGGRSALRASSRRNPRNLPCPTCKAPNRLTPADRALGYQCDSCADRCERGGDNLKSLARSCGWHGEDAISWIAGFYGAKLRELTR